MVLNGLGVVRYANPASQTVLASQLGEIIPFDTLRQSIEALALGRLPSPQCLSFDLGAPGSPRCVATTLMRSPVADEYLLILHPDDAGRHATAIASPTLSKCSIAAWKGQPSG